MQRAVGSQRNVSIPRESGQAKSLLEKVFVVNLARKPDRRARMRTRLDAAGLGVPVDFVPAVDGRTLEREALEKEGVSLYTGWKEVGSSVFYHARPLKMGEVGCALSHLAVWRRIADERLAAALVLEDDAVMAPDVASVLHVELERLGRLEPQWDLCYVGRKRLVQLPFLVPPAAPEPRLGERLVRPSFSYNLHAYVLSARGAQRLLAARFEENLIPVDEFVPAMYARHPRADVRDLFGEGDRLAAFAIDPSLAVQNGEGSDTEDSPFVPEHDVPAPQSTRRARSTPERRPPRATIGGVAHGAADRYRAVARVLGGEALADVAGDVGASDAELAAWRDAFLAAAPDALRAGAPFGLATLLDTPDPSDFVQHSWPHQVHVAHGRPDRLPLPAEILDVPRLVRTPGLRFSVFGKRGFRVGVARAEDALAFYGRGDTLYVVGLERAFPAMRDLCRALARDLDVDPRHVHVEGFASPAGAGASMHYDFDVNFNVQLKGSKTWRLAPNRHVENPLKSHHVCAGNVGVSPFDGQKLPASMPADARSIRARPGSVVFLPRGVWHETVVHGESFAIAFVVKPPPVSALFLKELEARLRLLPEWRAFALGVDRRRVVARALETLPAVLREVGTDEVLSGTVRARWPNGARRELQRLKKARHGERWSLRVSKDGGRTEYPIAPNLVTLTRWLTAKTGVFSTEDAIAECPGTSPVLARRVISYLADTGALERA